MKLINNLSTLFKETYRQITGFKIGLHGAAIAFYAIFSTAPMILILLWLISIVLGTEVGQAQFQQTLNAVVGAEIADSIQSMVSSAAYSTSGFWSTLIAIATLLFGATTLLAQVKKTLNIIWDVAEPQIGTLWHFFWDRLKALFFVGAIGILFLAGLISESVLYGMEHVLKLLFNAEDLFLIQLLSSGVNIVLTIVFFIALFKILPDLEVRLRDIAVGALFTALLFMVGKALVGWYLSGSGLEPAYKTAGSFVVFLIWIYYNVQIVLVGAVFTRQYTRLFGGAVAPYAGTELDEDW